EVKAHKGHAQPVSHMSFSSDGRLAVTCSGDHTIGLWDVQKGEEIRVVGTFPTGVHGAIFAPDNKSVLAFCGTQLNAAKPKTTKGKAVKGPFVPGPAQSCCVVQIDVGTGNVMQYWDELPTVPHNGVFLADGRQLLLAFGNGLKKWVPE